VEGQGLQKEEGQQQVQQQQQQGCMHVAVIQGCKVRVLRRRMADNMVDSMSTTGSADAEEEHVYTALIKLASSVLCACRPRVQLVGCSNRHCTRYAGPSAEGLVAGRKGVRCGGCRVARYCSPACQKADWPQHWGMCRRLAAAAAAAAPEPPPAAAAQATAAAAAAAQ
jgi:hypothetical protein